MTSFAFGALLASVAVSAQQTGTARPDTTNTISIKIARSPYYRDGRVVRLKTAVAIRALLSTDTRRSAYVVVLLSNSDLDLCAITDLAPIQAAPPIPPPPSLSTDADFILGFRIDDGQDVKNGGAEATNLFKLFFATTPRESTVPSAVLWTATMTDQAVIEAVGKLFPNQRVRVLEPTGRKPQLEVIPSRAENTEPRLVWSRFVHTGVFHVTAKRTQEMGQYQDAEPRDGFALISPAGDNVRVEMSFSGRDLTAAGTVHAKPCSKTVSHTWKF